MNDRTLAQEMARFVKILEARSDRSEYGVMARNRYGVARNLIAQAIVEAKHAARLAMQEAKAGKAVSR